jgi:hypothetical protein
MNTDTESKPAREPANAGLPAIIANAAVATLVVDEHLKIINAMKE